MFRKGRENEFYTRKARVEGYPARSVYKLKEINERFGVFQKGDWVLDLGSAPGSWLIYISEMVGKNGRIFGVDAEETKIRLPLNAVFIQKDIFEINESNFSEWQGMFRAVTADLSPKTIGIDFVDAGRSLELAEKAFELAQRFLKVGGNFVCKVFESAGVADFFRGVSRSFEIAKRFRPKATIKTSKEIYIVAKNFKKDGNMEQTAERN